MKIVVCSDAHPDTITMGVSRFDEVARSFREVVREAIGAEAKVFLFVGDLVDPDSGGHTFKAIRLVADAIRELFGRRIISIWMAGNHDTCEDGTGATTLTALRPLEEFSRDEFSEMQYVYIAEEPTLIPLGDDLDILCLPYPSVSQKIDMEERVNTLWPKNPKRRVIVASHLSIPGIVPGEETTEMPRGREVLLPVEATSRAILRLSGHYHRRQKFDPGDGGPPIRVVGSMARLSYNEEAYEPGFLVIDVPDA